MPPNLFHNTTMWLCLQVQLVGVHHHTKDMPDIANRVGSSICIFSFCARWLAKMGNSKERSKGQNVNKVWTPSEEQSPSLLLFLLFNFQIFTISVKRTPLIKFLTSVTREYDYMDTVKYVELRSVTMEKHDRVIPWSALRLYPMKSFNLHMREPPTHSGKNMEWDLSL